MRNNEGSSSYRNHRLDSPTTIATGGSSQPTYVHSAPSAGDACGDTHAQHPSGTSHMQGRSESYHEGQGALPIPHHSLENVHINNYWSSHERDSAQPLFYQDVPWSSRGTVDWNLNYANSYDTGPNHRSRVDNANPGYSHKMLQLWSLDTLGHRVATVTTKGALMDTLV